MNEHLMKLGEASKRLRISQITLRRIIQRKEINFHRIGRQYFISEKQLEDFMLRTEIKRDDR